MNNTNYICSVTLDGDKDAAPPFCFNSGTNLLGLCHSLAGTGDLNVQLPGLKKLIINFYRPSRWVIFLTVFDS